MSLEELLEESMRVSMDRMDTAVLHPRYSAYKTRIRHESAQEERRNAMLEHQKQQRASLMNGHRLGLPTSEAELKKLEKQLRKQEQLENKGTKSYDHGGKLIYKGVLMLSEWMVDVPPDLETAWIIRACPEGKRTLVVANRGWTRAFGRDGREIVKFPSYLPGGAFVKRSSTGNRSAPGGSGANPISSQMSGALTVLDCIFVRRLNAFYILDVISWGCDVANCEAEFRFFWLNSKLDESKIADEEAGQEDMEEGQVSGRAEEEDKMEEDGVTTGGKKRTWKYKFRRVKTLDYRDLVAGLPYPVYTGEDGTPLRLDGILFYHREGLYTWNGPKTPLVVWLKPFMLADILGFPVDPLYIAEKPPPYKSVKMDCAEEGGKAGSSDSKTLENSMIT